MKQKMKRLAVLLEYYTLFLIERKDWVEVPLEILLGHPEISNLTKDIGVIR